MKIALTAAKSLFWGLSDKRREMDHEPACSALWTHLLLEILRMSVDARPGVIMGVIQTLLRTPQLYGTTLGLGMSDECVWKVTLSLHVRRNALTPPSTPDTANYTDDVDTLAPDLASSSS